MEKDEKEKAKAEMCNIIMQSKATILICNNGVQSHLALLGDDLSPVNLLISAMNNSKEFEQVVKTAVMEHIRRKHDIFFNEPKKNDPNVN